LSKCSSILLTGLKTLTNFLDIIFCTDSIHFFAPPELRNRDDAGGRRRRRRRKV
jgi:hypothetical protein